MALPPYPVLCYGKDCSAPALYKIASHWSDGETDELKTYALSCEACLKTLYQSALKKRDACRLDQGETLDRPSIFDLQRGSRDKQLTRREDLEKSVA